MATAIKEGDDVVFFYKGGWALIQNIRFDLPVVAANYDIGCKREMTCKIIVGSEEFEVKFYNDEK